MSTLFTTRLSMGIRTILMALVLAAGLLASCATGPGSKPEAETQLPLAPEVIHGVLDNRLTWFVRPNPHPEGRAMVYLAVRSGSMAEDESQRGLAHFLEHMAFNGTKNFPGNDLVQRLQGFGVRFGPEINAYTGWDRTVYTLEVPTSDPGALDTALAILGDWARNISLDPAEVEAERTIIQEEWRLRLGVAERLQKAELPAMAPKSRAVQRMPIGDPEVFMKAPVGELERFYRDWYRPERMAVIVVGDVDAAAVTQTIAARFSGPFDNNPVRPDPDLGSIEPKDGSITYLAQTDAELGSSMVKLYFRQTWKPGANTKTAYLDFILQGLYSRIVNGRLEEAVARPDNPSLYSVSGFTDSVPGQNFLVWLTVPKARQMGQAVEELLLTRQQILSQGPSQSEFETRKKQYIQDLEQLEKEAGKTESSELADELARHFLEAEPAPGISWELVTTREYLETLDLASFRTWLAQVLGPSDLTALISAPESAADQILPEADFKALVAQVATRDLATNDEPAIGQGFDWPKPKAGTIVSKTFDQGIGAWKLVCGNQAVVWVKPTQLKNDQISFSAMGPGGWSLASDADFWSGVMADSLAGASGLGTLDAAAFTRALSGNTAGVSRSTSQYLASLAGGSSPKDLDTLMALINASFTGIRVDDDAAKAVLDAQANAIANRDNSPFNLFSQRIGEVLGGGHFRTKAMTVQDLAAVRVESARSFLSQAYQANGFVFCFSGNIDMESFEPLVASWIASLPGQKPALAWRDYGNRHPDGLRETVRAGKEPQSMVYQSWSVAEPYSYKGFVTSRVLREALELVLVKKIREEMGAVYSIGAYGGMVTIPVAELNLGIQYGCDPGRIDEISTAVRQILDDLAKTPVAEDQLAGIKKGLKETMSSDLQKNEVWASLVPQLVVLRGLPPDTILDYHKLVDGVSPADIMAMAARFRDEIENRFILLPAAE